MSSSPFYNFESSDDSVTVSSCGATVTSWKVAGEELLFLSSESVLDGTKAIRGGVPLCFPQFGPWKCGPQHGFARSLKWEFKEERKTLTSSKAYFILKSSPETEKIWPHRFECLYTVELGSKTLKMTLNVRNVDSVEWDFTVCFHNYFKVPNVSDCSIEGLKDVEFLDKTKNGISCQETRSEVKIIDHTDNVYIRAPDEVILRGFRGGKSLKILKTNLKDVVVWNPWAEGARKMSDFGDDEYVKMICVEPTTTSERILLEPGKEWTGSVELILS